VAMTSELIGGSRIQRPERSCSRTEFPSRYRDGRTCIGAHRGRMPESQRWVSDRLVPWKGALNLSTSPRGPAVTRASAGGRGFNAAKAANIHSTSGNRTTAKSAIEIDHWKSLGRLEIKSAVLSSSPGHGCTSTQLQEGGPDMSILGRYSCLALGSLLALIFGLESLSGAGQAGHSTIED
jgi:hypothetical protein